MRWKKKKSKERRCEKQLKSREDICANKAEHAVQSYAAGVGGLRGLGLWAIFTIFWSYDQPAYDRATLYILEWTTGGKESNDN